jgi:hypothetical protein
MFVGVKSPLTAAGINDDAIVVAVGVSADVTAGVNAVAAVVAAAAAGMVVAAAGIVVAAAAGIVLDNNPVEVGAPVPTAKSVAVNPAI